MGWMAMMTVVASGYRLYNECSLAHNGKSWRMSPILDPNSLECPSHSADQTQRLGVRLGELLQAGDIVCLEGPLGAGKTCLAQGIGRGCGITDSLISPTFTLIHEYKRPRNGTALYHVDLYRISGAREAADLGLDEYLDDPSAITLIEWPEQAQELLPAKKLWVSIRLIGGTKRILMFSAQGGRYEALLRAFRKQAFGI
jgi:tRNA threonylcarbamoyladenosine biosynthesis protein TsaE